MKLLRFGSKDKEKPGIIDGTGNIRDLSGYIQDISGVKLAHVNLTKIRSLDLQRLPIIRNSVRYGSCVGDVRRIICVGLNYKDHIKETNSPVPSEPVIFAKLCSATGPNDDIFLPPYSKKTDWEVELGVVIGKEAEYIKKSEAQEHIFGYCVINDLSEREFQIERGGGQWTKGKSFRGFAPIGPWLVTKDEIDNIQDLNIWLKVNDVEYQRSNTKNMIFDVNHLVSYISQFIVLMPGDIISTGTPHGVGMGLKPKPMYLKDSDIITLGIEKLGVQCQHIYRKSGE